MQAQPARVQREAIDEVSKARRVFGNTPDLFPRTRAVLENAQIVGKWNPGQMQVMGPEDDPTILNVGIDPLCSASGPSAWCIQAYKSGQYAATVVAAGSGPMPASKSSSAKASL